MGERVFEEPIDSDPSEPEEEHVFPERELETNDADEGTQTPAPRSDMRE